MNDYSIYTHKLFIILFAVIIVGSISCTKGFDKLNQNPTAPNEGTSESFLTYAEKSLSNILFEKQVNGNIGMLYAQYWCQTQSVENQQYRVDELNNNELWSLYNRALSNLQEAINQASTEAVNPDNKIAIANLLKDYTIQILTDAYGNIPYQNILTGDENPMPAYMNSKTIYDSLLVNIDAQISKLNSGNPSYGAGDVIYKGDINKWKKFGNSLKVRIGLRYIKTDIAKAKQIIESAYQSGVFQSNQDQALFNYSSQIPDQYPFNSESGLGIPNDFQVSATLINYMKSLQDPRLTIYARNASKDDSIIGKPYNSGISALPDYSYPGVKVYSPTMDGILISYAETAFSLAEAAANGINVGDAENNYKNGIKSNMNYWGITDNAQVDKYVAENPYKKEDWKNIIGTQKWLAMYNQGLQSWFERMRLDFRKPGGEPLFVPPLQSLDPSVTIVPNRLSYPISEYEQNQSNYLTAQQAMGNDSKAFLMWWQTLKN